MQQLTAQIPEAELFLQGAFDKGEQVRAGGSVEKALKSTSETMASCQAPIR